jgi:hypothetical protein
MSTDEDEHDDGSPDELKSDVALTVRVSRELRDALFEAAKVEHRSMTMFLTVLAEDALRDMGKWPPKGPEAPEPKAEPKGSPKPKAVWRKPKEKSK